MKTKLFRKIVQTHSRASLLLLATAYCLVRAGLKPAPYCLLLLALLLLLPLAAFAQPDLTVCANQGFMLTSKADAQSISGGVTYTWYESYNNATAGSITNSNTPSLTVADGKEEAGTYKYVRWVASDACPDGVPSNTYTVLVNPLPTITLSSANSAQTVKLGQAIAPINYTTANATGASISGQPAGVTVAWANNTCTVSGTPTDPGTAFTCTVSATHTSNCQGAAATATLTIQRFLTSNTYQVSSYVLSAPVVYVPTTTECSFIQDKKGFYIDMVTAAYTFSDVGVVYYNGVCMDLIATHACGNGWTPFAGSIFDPAPKSESDLSPGCTLYKAFVTSSVPGYGWMSDSEGTGHCCTDTNIAHASTVIWHAPSKTNCDTATRNNAAPLFCYK